MSVSRSCVRRTLAVCWRDHSDDLEATLQLPVRHRVLPLWVFHIDIHVRGDRTFAIQKAPGARELLARLRKYRGRLPEDFKFDRAAAHERG